ncbi:helix-turn-helix domain-containing protein [Psychromonas hadalis]|uniref:helix-turn-helix domain-containing protein n=1 Tax=Psychromonas hadalis TaxID=211669 RepID=UPI0003B5C02F|nr:XRE family transcriptional regulator [Psychromonas hadalis]
MSINFNNAIGLQLKLARTNKDWSLDVTSKHTGVSKAMLGQIERGESSPTVARLWNIATGFHLPLSYFFLAIEDNDLSKNMLNSESGISISTLFPFDLETKSEVFSLTLAPLHQQISAPHNDGVIEHILVIEGEIEYLLNDQWHHLNKGEVVKFNANQKHGYRNVSESQAVFHNIIYYTSKNKFSV